MRFWNAKPPKVPAFTPILRRTFSENLQHRRTMMGYSKRSVALALGVRVHTYNEWEKRGGVPDFDHLERLCHLLDCQPSFLFAPRTEPFDLDDYLNRIEIEVELAKPLD